MRLALIFDQHRADTTGVYFKRAAHALGLPVDHWWLRDAARIPAAYDLYVRIDHGDDYAVALPARLHPSVFFVSDTHLPYNWPKIHQAARCYDLMVCAQRSAAHRLSGAAWLPFGCDPSLAEPTPLRGPWDLAFIGSDGGVPRKFILQALRERYPHSYLGPAPHTQLAAIYQQAKIGFNYSVGAELNMRIFEVLGAGTLLVTNALQDESLEQLGLHDGTHYIAYRDPEALFACIDGWLTRDDERRRIAQAGMAEVRAHHTYVHRLRQLLDIVSQRFGMPTASTRAAERVT